MEYTLSESLKYAKNNQLENWLHLYFLNEGNNKDLYTGLKKDKRFYLKPIKMPLYLFERCCGPEKNMKYTVKREDFERRVIGIQDRLQNGWDMPPLFINYSEGKYEINDGNHRYEALIRNKVMEYYIVFWCTNEYDYIELISKIGERILDNL